MSLGLTKGLGMYPPFFLEKVVTAISGCPAASVTMG